MARWLLVLLLVLASCGGADRADEIATPAGCPAVPNIRPTELTDIVWPSETARGLVPDFEDVCATPTSPQLFLLLNESASWSSELRTVAHGILHRGDQEIATFSVIRLRPELTAGAKEHVRSQAATTVAGDVTLAWGGGGPHVMVTWVHDDNIVALFAAGPEPAAEGAELWLQASGVEASVTRPDQIPQSIVMPPELGAGPPLEDLPPGYTALTIDPLSFIGSDFADAVTIHEEKGLEALGASIVVADDGTTLIGTAIAGLGRRRGYGSWPARLDRKHWNAEAGGAAAGFTEAGTDVLVVGHDESAVRKLSAAWERAATT